MGIRDNATFSNDLVSKISVTGKRGGEGDCVRSSSSRQHGIMMEMPQQSTEQWKLKQTFVLVHFFGKSRSSVWFHPLDYFPLKY